MNAAKKVAAKKVGAKKSPAKKPVNKPLVKRTSVKKAPMKKTPVKKAAARGKSAKPGEQAEFLARAWAMENEAAERYAMFADAMEEHNNRDVAELFRKLARIEQIHADQLLEENPSIKPPQENATLWGGDEGPETADPGDLHYRMQPYHALQIALAAEQRAEKFYKKLARDAKLARVRAMAVEMAAEEEEHVRLINEWLVRTPKPDTNWEIDPDPPVLSD